MSYPQVRILENGANLGFARGNNAGIRVAKGEYVLILNPDTIIHDGALDKWIAFADRHREAGAFGCRVLNPDGLPGTGTAFSDVAGILDAALYVRWLGYLGELAARIRYVGWTGQTEREIDWQSGCCILVRGHLLETLGGFDERFFYHFEEVDLCKRIWSAGHVISTRPVAVITHLGGQSVARFPTRFAIEKLPQSLSLRV